MKIITGMHRSGTSLVTRLFYEAGADLGDPETLYPGDRWNPDGYFEQPAVHSLNMDLINGRWGKLAYFALPSTRVIEQRATRHASQIQAVAADYRGKVVKDCRFCLTLPAWTAHGASVDRLLVCLRDPIAVARSLKKRNRATQRHAYKLWMLHNERLLQHAADLPIRFVYYSYLFDEARFYEEMKPAFGFFGLQISEEDLLALQRQFVKPQLNHSRDTSADYPAEVEALWQQLRDRHAQQPAEIQAAASSL